MTTQTLKIDVYKYPEGSFLGTRFAPHRKFENGEKIISNADEINEQVDEVRKLHKKGEGEIYFRTSVVL